jgi:hypothetical protein
MTTTRVRQAKATTKRPSGRAAQSNRPIITADTAMMIMIVRIRKRTGGIRWTLSTSSVRHCGIPYCNDRRPVWRPNDGDQLSPFSFVQATGGREAGEAELGRIPRLPRRFSACGPAGGMLQRECSGMIISVARRARPLSVVYQSTIRAEADMKAAGIVLTIVGVLMLFSGVNLALTKYDLKSSHDLSKLFGGLGLSALVLLGGVAMIIKSRSNR